MKNLITAIILWSAITTASAAEKVKLPAGAADTTTTDIKKVVVTGNVIVYFVQGKKEEVFIDEGDISTVSVKRIGHKLSISSNEQTPSVVTVYFTKIYRIDASENTIVHSVGKLHMENLQILLRDNARARIKAVTNSLYTVVNNEAKLELLGTTQHLISNTEGEEKLNTKNLIAKTVEYQPETEIIATR